MWPRSGLHPAPIQPLSDPSPTPHVAAQVAKIEELVKQQIAEARPVFAEVRGRAYLVLI